VSTRTFTVRLACEITVTQELLDAVLTDDWRRNFFQFHDAQDVASHLAFNLAQGHPLELLDGFADQPHGAATLADLDIDDVQEVEDGE
jgi:hypothetical protein